MKRNQEIKPKQKLPPKSSVKKDETNISFSIGILLILTFFAYLPALKAGFLLEWDDPDYVTNNLLIRSFSNIGKLLATPVQQNFHPLTMLSLAFNYAISGDKAWSYHLLNVVLHLANTFLVYKLSSRLSKDNKIISFTVAMLFALHPMHVESVAWIAERKDVLYSFFFLLGLISYTDHLNSNSKKSYYYCILWFVLSLLSKPAAVIFPVALFTIDLLYKRKFSLRLITEKIPFFLLAAILGYVRFQMQKNDINNASSLVENFTAMHRIFFMFYGFMMYFFKMILPINLNAFYQMPLVKQELPMIYYISPFFFLLVLIFCIYTLKKNNVFAFGFSFYFVNLILVSNLFFINSAIISERYTYIPYIGLFYIVAWLIDKWQHQSVKAAMNYLYPLAILLAIMTFNQSATWASSRKLWEHAVKVNPNYQVYKNMAFVYFTDKNQDKELESYNKALTYNAGDAEIYSNRGSIYLQRKMFDEALNDFNVSLSIDSNYAKAISNRGTLYAMQGKYDLALNDLNKVIQINPEIKINYKNRGLVYFKRENYNEAISNFKKYLEFEPDNLNILNMIGLSYQSLNQQDSAISIFNKLIEASPVAEFYLNRSVSWNALGKNQEAKNDAIKVREMGGQLPDSLAKTLGL